jgi:uncharacterized protein (TIGR02646 family)
MFDLIPIEPDFFIEFKRKNNHKRYTDDCDDYSLRNSLRDSMIQDQRGQCFYCEKKITNDSTKVHIDHIMQRDSYHNLECDYENMVLSCNGDGEKYCGKYKDKQSIWDDNKFICLVSDNKELREKPSEVFVYMSSGKIKAKNSLSYELKKRTTNTIDYLNLNHKDLIGARKIISLALASYEIQGLDKQEIFTYFNEFENIFK